MTALYWLFIPIGATLVAMLLATWLGRPRRSVDRYDQVKQFHLFCEAMEDESAKRRAHSDSVKPITRSAE